MHLLRNLSIKHKLQAITMSTVAAALLLASAALLASQTIGLRNSMKAGLQMLAGMIGENSTAALSFGDTISARELLQDGAGNFQFPLDRLIRIGRRPDGDLLPLFDAPQFLSE
jgi:hypothetical protein